MIRYRFKTRSVEDFRPLVDMAPIQMPWWCSGSGMRHGEPFCTIICYLPDHEDLFKYWDDAFDIEKEYPDKIIYTDRFPKPEWIKEEPCTKN